VSTTDTESFLGTEDKWSAEPILSARRIPLPAADPSPIDKQVHFLILVPTERLAAHEAVLVLGNAVERCARLWFKAPSQ
jgi:hypothetical protein